MIFTCEYTHKGSRWNCIKIHAESWEQAREVEALIRTGIPSFEVQGEHVCEIPVSEEIIKHATMEDIRAEGDRILEQVKRMIQEKPS